YGETWAKLQQPEKIVGLLAPNTGSQTAGFDSAIQTVLKNEGGFVAVDGSSGAPAIYGINAKWHPDDYAEAKRVTDEKGPEAGQRYAQDFYRREYWDKYQIADLPAPVQTIVMDGVVNHTEGFDRRLVDAARGGATPDQLIEMRRTEYQRLATANP